MVPDLLMKTNQQTIVLDVAKCNPDTACYTEIGSNRIIGKAAAEMEQHKFDTYRKIRGLVESGNVVPFVVEATGRLGERARQFLESIAETRPDLRNRFVDQLNVVINHASGQIQYHLRDRLTGPAQG